MNRSNTKPPQRRRTSATNLNTSFKNTSARFSPLRSSVISKASQSRNDINESNYHSKDYYRHSELDNEILKREPFNAKAYIIPGLTEKDVELLKEVFDYYDTDKNGQLTPGEIRAALINGGYHASK